MSTQRPPNEPLLSSSMSSWDCMLPGPPSKNNGGAADLSTAGLLAYASGSSVAIVDFSSMQLVFTFPLPPHPSSVGTTAAASLSPFITAVRWSPLPLPHHLLENSSSHLVLSVGDRHGRISLIDLRSKSTLLYFDTSNSSSSKLGIQDLCWIQVRPDSWALGVLSGSSLLSLYNTTTGRCFFKYDASPEYFSCLRRDPFDARHFCALGLKGFLLSVKLLGDSEHDVILQELQIRADTSELQRLERDSSGISSNNGAPALAVFPNYVVKFAFSPHWKHVIFVGFPRELVVFDLQYQSVLSSAGLPRGCGKFLEVLPDANAELLYCAHLDGKLSTWRRKEGEQVHIMCLMEELIPSIGTSVPSPSVLAVTISQSDSTLQSICKLCSDASSLDVDFDNPFDFCDESLIISKTHLISISDDGKIWKWLLTAEGSGDARKDIAQQDKVSEVGKVPVPESESSRKVTSTDDPLLDAITQPDKTCSNKNHQSSSTNSHEEVLFKTSLVGQLHLLSSTVTMLAVPSPSLTATLARGGNAPAVAVPLVALGTQNGMIDVIDISANAVASSFSVHSSVVRGLRWLGNSRLVSFSYTQGSEKTGGYINRLVVTCLRSGLNRTFRVLQKPERAPIRALRASSSGRYLLILFRDAPVEVWAMTKTPIMLRSLALPFTVLEWTLPTVPHPTQNKPSKSSSFLSRDQAGGPTGTLSPTKASSTDSKEAGGDGSQEEFSESFAFALVNGALGVFEVHGRRIRDFRPKWPSSSLVSSDGLITAMAYRLPHVVIGDRSGNIRWWDVTTGQSSSFNTHREGVRRIKFSPVVPGDRSRGRIAVLFYDNTFSVLDLDSSDPLANSLLQPQFPGTLVLELDWLPSRTDKNDPLVLCIAGADSSFRLIEVNANDQKMGFRLQAQSVKERFRPLPLSSPILLPTPHALALRMILQLGVKPTWFNAFSTTMNKTHSHIPGTPSSEDLRSYMLDSPRVGDSVVPEMLLKVLEPYRKEGCLLDDQRVRLYASLVNKGFAARLAFAAAVFGESTEALFWLQLPQALNHLMIKLVNKSQKGPHAAAIPEIDEASMLSRISSKGKSVPGEKKNPLGNGQLRLMAFEQAELWESAMERIPWHEKLESEEAIQNHIHE
ncbi:WD repeat-containing 11 isoform X1 [Olea europaea subsp. europaea]|nr:WD repeat-containing 11 isoform X1 [Olea europaea subsp. europaea]